MSKFMAKLAFGIETTFGYGVHEVPKFSEILNYDKNVKAL